MYDVTTRRSREQPTVVVRGRASVANLPTFLGDAYAAIVAHLERAGSQVTGMPFARYQDLGGHVFEVEAGFPVDEPVAGDGDGQVVPSTLPGGPTASTWHVGPYGTLGAAYEVLATWVREHDGTPDGDAWEIYHSDPVSQPDPETWRTEVVQPYR